MKVIDGGANLSEAYRQARALVYGKDSVDPSVIDEIEALRDEAPESEDGIFSDLVEIALIASQS